MSGTLTLEILLLLLVRERSSGPFYGSQNLQWSPVPLSFNLHKSIYTCLAGCPPGPPATWYVQRQVGAIKPEPELTLRANIYIALTVYRALS